MVRSITYGVALAGSATIAAALTAQVAPPVADAPGPDIVVNGATPKMVAGLWRFRPGLRMANPAPGQKMARPQQGKEWTRCIADGDTAAIVDQLIGEQAGMQALGGGGVMCSALKVSIRQRRVQGSRSCTMVTGGATAYHVTTDVRATIAETQLSADYMMEGANARSSRRVARWTVKAERIGDCPNAARTAPTPPAQPVPTPSPTQTAGSTKATEPTIVRETSAAPSDQGTTVATKPPTPIAGGEPEDIVVIARRLKRLRLHYGVSGDRVNWCHADISSGDKRVDRIGCAIVRACTKSGSDTVEATLACFRRRVDSLEPDAPPA